MQSVFIKPTIYFCVYTLFTLLLVNLSHSWICCTLQGRFTYSIPTEKKHQVTSKEKKPDFSLQACHVSQLGTGKDLCGPSSVWQRPILERSLQWCLQIQGRSSSRQRPQCTHFCSIRLVKRI